MYAEYLPIPSLRSRLECVWTNSSTSTETHTVYPDGCMDILYTRLGNRSELQVVGTMTEPHRFITKTGTQFIGFRFHPGKAPWGLPAAELLDRAAPLTEVMSARGLQDRMDNASDPAAVLSAWLAARVQPPTPLEMALGYLQHGDDLDHIAAAANLSTRQFRRRCAELTGLSPRHLARVVRFRKALAASLPPTLTAPLPNRDREGAVLARVALRTSPRPNWSAIALDAGYFDQAHLIRDFREFAGATPMAVFSNTAAATAV